MARFGAQTPEGRAAIAAAARRSWRDPDTRASRIRAPRRSKEGRGLSHEHKAAISAGRRAQVARDRAATGEAQP